MNPKHEIACFSVQIEQSVPLLPTPVGPLQDHRSVALCSLFGHAREMTRNVTYAS